MKYNWDINLIQEYVKESDSLSEVLRKLNIPIQGNNIGTLRKRIEEYHIDISHFTYGNKRKTGILKRDINDYLNNNVYISSAKLRNRLIQEGYKENKCEKCGCTEWLDNPIVIQLHHIDGNHTNNAIENLQMLCPNCHSITENYSGKSNKKKYNYCFNCGKEIGRNSTYCPACAALNNRKVQRPSLLILIDTVKELQNFTNIGKYFNVSDNTIRKWLKYYNLPTKLNEIMQLSDDDIQDKIKEFADKSKFASKLTKSMKDDILNGIDYKDFISKYPISKKTYYNYKKLLEK